MKNKLFITILAMYCTSSYALEVSVASLCYNDSNVKEQSALDAGKVISNLYIKEKLNESSCIGWTNLGAGSIWYDVTSEPKINAIDVKEKKLIGVWPLTPWSYLSPPKEFIEAQSIAGISTESSKLYLDSNKNGLGCLNQMPLRYGKISNQPTQENLLVLLLNRQLIFFSPQYQRTVFATHYDASDALSKTESDELREDYGPRFMEEDAQFISGIFYGAYNIGMPGHRIYSKIYIDDFNQDGNADVLLWRKYYKSNKSTEDVGFTLLRNEFTHYTRDLTAQQKSEAGATGEYLPQDTSPETLQQWLTAKNLTWQKGYPSKSECSGQEGQLIPEMHDPLLNDPDVLQ